jgi:hypothetical protein
MGSDRESRQNGSERTGIGSASWTKSVQPFSPCRHVRLALCPRRAERNASARRNDRPPSDFLGFCGFSRISI